MRTPQGMERKRVRDRARMLALAVVARSHEDEHRRIYHDEVGGSQQARWNRALGVIARRYDDEYREAFEAALTELGYESHAGSSMVRATTIGPENECCPAVGTDRAAFPNPVEGSEMGERTHAVTAGEVR